MKKIISLLLLMTLAGCIEYRENQQAAIAKLAELESKYPKKEFALIEERNDDVLSLVEKTTRPTRGEWHTYYKISKYSGTDSSYYVILGREP